MIHVHFLKHSASTIRWILLLMMLSSSALAAPFAKKFPFVQPDGTTIELWGEGDEFHAVFETLDGYTVVFDPAVKTYFYATRSADGSTLEATSVQAGKGKPAQLGIPKHARINAAAKKEKAAERFKKWDKEMGISKRWSDLKSARRTANQA
ncbi:MAG: hypothetical protein FJ220_02100, partial [Kiritimatiellaceae bacterium]|nr:hypothetical protein [Kiritimatiellaceae bacterium]